MKKIDLISKAFLLSLAGIFFSCAGFEREESSLKKGYGSLLLTAKSFDSGSVRTIRPYGEDDISSLNLKITSDFSDFYYDNSFSEGEVLSLQEGTYNLELYSSDSMEDIKGEAFTFKGSTKVTIKEGQTSKAFVAVKAVTDRKYDSGKISLSFDASDLYAEGVNVFLYLTEVKSSELVKKAELTYSSDSGTFSGEFDSINAGYYTIRVEVYENGVKSKFFYLSDALIEVVNGLTTLIDDVFLESISYNKTYYVENDSTEASSYNGLSSSYRASISSLLKKYNQDAVTLSMPAYTGALAGTTETYSDYTRLDGSLINENTNCFVTQIVQSSSGMTGTNERFTFTFKISGKTITVSLAEWERCAASTGESFGIFYLKNTEGINVLLDDTAGDVDAGASFSINWKLTSALDGTTGYTKYSFEPNS